MFRQREPWRGIVYQDAVSLLEPKGGRWRPRKAATSAWAAHPARAQFFADCDPAPGTINVDQDTIIWGAALSPSGTGLCEVIIANDMTWKFKGTTVTDTGEVQLRFRGGNANSKLIFQNSDFEVDGFFAQFPPTDINVFNGNLQIINSSLTTTGQRIDLDVTGNLDIRSSQLTSV